ncbi:MAG TPA: NnrU family protein [Burkholderiales bacterium]|nr:NnrU family protein [Burkholderiales bacterium]
MSAAYWIVFWWLVFAGSHMVLSSLPLRGQLIARLGEKGFVGLYSLIAFATFIPLVWVYFGNRHTGGVIWNLAAAPGVRPLAAALAVLAIALIVGGVLHPSPALVGMKQSWGARGLTRITRHPVFMGFALWALSHLLLNGFLTDILFFGGMLAFSLAGAAHQDARKRATEEKRLGQFFAESSYWPFGAIIAGRNRIIWRELPWIALAVGAAAAIGIYALHPWAFA